MIAKIKMRQYIIFVKPQKFDTAVIKCFYSIEIQLHNSWNLTYQHGLFDYMHNIIKMISLKISLE